MKKRIIAFSIFAVSLAGLIIPALERASAQATIPGMIAQQCATEIVKYCKDVEPGYGRIDSCLYSRSDKLSYDCAYTIYDASEQLRTIREALDKLADQTSCRSDIKQFCAGLAPEPGLIYHCIKKNQTLLTDGCRFILPNAEQLLRRAGMIN